MTLAPTRMQRRRAPQRLDVLFAIVALAAVAAVVALVVARSGVFGSSSSGTVVGSGRAVEQARYVAPFAAVDLAGSNNVVVHVGGARSVVVRADDNLAGRVTTRVESDRLVIANKSGSYSTRTPMSVTITVPTLRSLVLAGAGTITADGITGTSFTILMPGSGLVRTAGRVERLDVVLAGSGDAQLQQLEAAGVHATVSGSGRIVVFAKQWLRAAVTGTGSIAYGGDPARVTKAVTGTGSITPR